MFWKKGNKDKKDAGTWGKAARTGKWKGTKQLRDKLDRIFSEYIRLRDAKEFGGKYFRCISCGRVLPFAQADCGHYISRTNMALRFSEQNCSAQCRYCNRFKDGNVLEYRQGLARKIGEKSVELLESRRHEARKWSAWELEQLIDYYGKETGRLKEEMDNE